MRVQGMSSITYQPFLYSRASLVSLFIMLTNKSAPDYLIMRRCCIHKLAGMRDKTKKKEAQESSMDDLAPVQIVSGAEPRPPEPEHPSPFSRIEKEAFCG